MQKENKFFSFHFRVHGKFDASQSYEKTREMQNIIVFFRAYSDNIRTFAA